MVCRQQNLHQGLVTNRELLNLKPAALLFSKQMLLLAHMAGLALKNFPRAVYVRTAISLRHKMNPFKNGMVGAVYVIHVPKFTDRAAHIRAELGRFEIPFEFVLPYDAEDLNQETHDRFLAPGGRLNSRDLSLILKHMEACRRMLAGGHQLTLILEDDVVLDKHFNEELSAIIKEAKAFTNPFTIQIGCANNMFVPGHRLRPGQRLYEAHEVRATDSFLINAAAARVRLDWLESHQFDRPVGHLFNQIDAEKKISIHWSEPTIVEQGSMTGLFHTALDTGRKDKSLKQQRRRYLWQHLRKKYLYRLFRWKF